MSETLLYIQDVFTHLQEMRGTGMAERMNRERMVETSFHKCILEDSADISRFDGLRCHPSAMAFEHEVIAGKSFLEDA